MTAPGPGWYADPTGEPGLLRWWDGTEWTKAWTTDPTTPPPSQPATRTRPDTVIPPPEGAPGPSYVLSTLSPVQPGSTQRPPSAPEPSLPPKPPEPAPDRHEGSDRRRVLLVTAIVAALIVIAGGGYLLLAPEESPQAQGEPANSNQTPGNPQNPERSGPAPGQAPRLEFTPLSGDWEAGTGGVLSGGMSQRQTVEAGYDGSNNWVASVSTGRADPTWYDPSDLRASAQQLTTRFARESFRGARMKSEPRKLGTYNVDGRPGYLLQQRFSFRLPKLKTTAEMVTVVVVDLGQGRGGAFLASIPNVKPALLGEAEQAMNSLKVVR